MTISQEERRKQTKKELLIAIRKNGRSPISKFTTLLGLDYNYVKKYIDELEQEGLIKKEVETTATYVMINEQQRH